MLAMAVTFIIVIGAGFILANTQKVFRHGHEGPEFINKKRTTDLRNLQISLEIYHEENGNYPITTDCSDVGVLGGLAVGFDDPLSDSGWSQYEYSSDSNGGSYVLKASLQKLDSDYYYGTHVGQDLDGLQLGCQCDDPNYCVSNKVPVDLGPK